MATNESTPPAEEKPAAKKPAAKKPAAKKPAAKKPAAKKPAAKKPTAKKPAAKKPAAKKPAAKKPAAKKPAAKKPTAKKPAAKKPAAKKPAAKKPAAKKPAAKKPAVEKPAEISHEHVGLSAKENMQQAADAIDKQMKTIANMDTRILIAMDKLSEIQERLHERSIEFQKKNTKAAKQAWENAKQALDKHHGIIDEIKHKRQQAMDALKEHKTLHETYETIVEQLEKGKKKAIIEARKAEASFMKQLHKIEEQMLKKAEQIKKRYNKD
jgi:hypothetical protein